MTEYADYKLLLEARDELKKAFHANAGLRSQKVDLEKKVEKLRQKLMENEEVDAVLRNPKFSKLAVLKERQFLRDIEAEVAEEHKKKKRKAKRKEKAGTIQKRTRLTQDQKRQILRSVCQNKKSPVLVADLAAGLEAAGVKTQPSTFLTQCDVPKAALKRVSSSPRDGTHFYPDKVRWLLERLEAEGVVKKVGK